MMSRYLNLEWFSCPEMFMIKPKQSAQPTLSQTTFFPKPNQVFLMPKSYQSET